MKTVILFVLCFFSIVVFFNQANGQTKADPRLLAEINKIKAIDHHAHPLTVGTKDELEDLDCDPLNFAEIERFDAPVRLRPDNPEYIGAWREFFGYKYNDMSEAHVKELVETKQRFMKERGEAYPSWILDKLGIETMLANRMAMGRGLAAPRFRWVAFMDALMFPLNNSAVANLTPDYKQFYSAEEKLLKRYMTEVQVNSLPKTLDEYLSKIITPLLERRKESNALAIKFEAAYLRSLQFDNPSKESAAKVYAQYLGASEVPASDYKVLQDFIFRYTAREAGRLGLAVHIHVGGGGGAYFKLAGSNPTLLESVFDDPTLRKTNFVIIHGGWPATKETAFIISKPNVYADFSVQEFLMSNRGLSEVLRMWLEFNPEKVLFGTDAFAIIPEVGWEEMCWLATNSARQSLAIALTAMINDGQITRARALELAKMVMRENAVKLYKLPK